MMIYLLMIDSPEDRSKFEILYVEYRDAMYKKAFSLLHNQEDAEDAVHQAFVKIAENIEIIDGTICPRTKGLVITIVQNIVYDMLRHKKRLTFVSLESVAEPSIEYQGDNILAQCMAKLPAKYQTVLLLKHLHGFSSKEAAKIMGLTEANIIKMDQRAKKKLEILCKEEGLL